MADASHNALPDTILFDGVLWPVKSPIGYRNLARFENRVIIGDPSKDDDELLSGRVWSDFSGGCGIFEEKEGADNGVFWDAEGVDIDHPGQLALGPAVQSFVKSPAGTNALMMGESGGKVHISFDKNVYEFDEGTDTVGDTTYNLSFDPVNKGINFDSRLWIPQGADGYETFRSGIGVEAASVTAGTGITAVSFCLWDNKLVALEHDGQLSFYDPLTDVWDSPSGAKLESSQTPRDVIVYFTRSDEPAVYVMSTEAVWGYNEIAQVMVKTSLVLPRHPDNGKGMAIWKVGESMHIAASMGVYAWTGPGGTAAPIGLDRKQGVPLAYQGRITDLTPTNNHLWALVEANGNGSYHSVYRYNGGGWVRVWAHTNKTDSVDWMMTTGTASTQRVWWNTGNKVYSIVVPRNPANPREIVAGSVGNFTTTGYLITSWFDANMKGFDKLFSYLLTNIYKVAFGSGRNVTISYQDDPADTSWTSLAFAAFEGSYWWAMNFSSQQIRFKVTLNSSTATLSPIVDSFVGKFMRIPTSYGTWQVTFDLNYEGLRFDRDAQQTAHDLEDLLTKRTIIVMEHNQNQYNVRVSNVQGWDGTAEDRRKSRTATFVEVPYPGDQSFAAAGA